MPSPIAGLCLDISKPGRCYLLHPVTSLPLTVIDRVEDPEAVGGFREVPGEQAYVDILSYDSEPAQEHRFARADREFRSGPIVPGSRADWEENGRQLAKMVTGWLLVDLHGRKLDVPCIYDLAEGLFNSSQTRWLRNQVQYFVANPGNFPAASSTS